MADDELTTLEPESPRPLSAGFLLSMEDEPQILRFSEIDPSNPDRYFILARHPGMKEDRITAESGHWSTPINREVQRSQEAEQVMVQTPAAGFVAKCLYQIEDFLLPPATKGGPDLRWSPQKEGVNDANRQVYQLIFRRTERGTKDSMSLRELVEGFLDHVAGRSSMEAEDFLALGSSSSPRPASS